MIWFGLVWFRVLVLVEDSGGKKLALRESGFCTNFVQGPTSEIFASFSN
jgi:hypothetical protein